MMMLLTWNKIYTNAVRTNETKKILTSQFHYLIKPGDLKKQHVGQSWHTNPSFELVQFLILKKILIVYDRLIKG